MIKKALDLYTGKNGIRLNCAQAVTCAAKSEYGVSEKEIDSLKAFSAGRAPDGMCGAIYAAHRLIASRSSDAAEMAISTFRNTIGEVRCREIKTARKHSCSDCVAEAAVLVEKYITKTW